MIEILYEQDLFYGDYRFLGKIKKVKSKKYKKDKDKF